MAMNYDRFRAAWHEALDATGLLPFAPWPTETVDLSWVSRTYSIIVELRSAQQIKPFYITASLSWRWDALQSARSATTEEDVLMELLGQDAYYQATEQP